MNTFQAIAVSNGTESYALFTYKCGEMEWSDQAVIGYNGGSPTDYFFNHPLSGTDDAQTIACQEFPDSVWTNLWHKISNENVVTSPPPVTVEPGKHTACIPCIYICIVKLYTQTPLIRTPEIRARQ